MVFDADELASIRKGKYPDFKESFDMGESAVVGSSCCSHVGNEASKRCKNVWLEDQYLPGLRSTCVEFMGEGRKLQIKALRALAIGMPGVPDKFFDEYHSDADNQLRLLHYPSAPRAAFESGEKGRIGAHTASGVSTLARSSLTCRTSEHVLSCSRTTAAACKWKIPWASSLTDLAMTQRAETSRQVCRRDPHPRSSHLQHRRLPHAMVERRTEIDPSSRSSASCTTGKRRDDTRTLFHPLRACTAAPQWVLAHSQFCTANIDRVIDALPGTFSDTRPKKYSPITAGEYVDMRLNATYVKAN